MNLIGRIKDALGFGPRLRNKPGSMAWIVGMHGSDGDGTLNGRAVKTVRVQENGLWQIDPPQKYIVARATFYVLNNHHAFPGDVVSVIGLGDEYLEPWKEDGVTDEEVRDLYAPKTHTPAKEPAHG